MQKGQITTLRYVSTMMMYASERQARQDEEYSADLNEYMIPRQTFVFFPVQEHI